MANEAPHETRDKQRTALIFRILSQQCRTGHWDNSEIINAIRAAGLAPTLTPEEVCHAVRDFEERRLAEEIDEIYFKSFWLGGDQDETAMMISDLY